MRKLLFLLLLLSSMTIHADALELLPPEVPEAGIELMPEDISSFLDGLAELYHNALGKIRPDLKEASRIVASVVSAGTVLSVLQSFSGCAKRAATMAGIFAAASILLTGTDSLIHLGVDTIRELSDYGKLLLPVMTAAMAAQGFAATSAALYTGTAMFDAILSALISKLLTPMVYLYLALAISAAAVGEILLKKMRDLIRQFVSWSLKTLLTVFTTYMSISGVICGTTDAVALKATKMTISTVVPVVGGILSDASETVLVGAALVKNSAGLYGIFAILAVFLSPFLTIGIHYLLMKFAAAVCSLLGSPQLTELTGDFSTAMGLLLAMTGSVCLLQLISTICFLKGIR